MQRHLKHEFQLCHQFHCHCLANSKCHTTKAADLSTRKWQNIYFAFQLEAIVLFSFSIQAVRIAQTGLKAD